jgi:hypothetical protein
VEGIGDAENAIFTEDGRFFVTGGENAYEIVRQGDGYAAMRRYQGTCNFTGLAVRARVLYAACFLGDLINPSGGYLLAGDLDSGPQLEIIHSFEDVRLANGMAFDDQGRLYVADSALLAGKIAVIALDPDDPMRVASERTWHAEGYNFVNGMKFFQGALYVTDATDIKRIAVQPDGSPGAMGLLVRHLTVFDDLYISASGIYATDFVGGSVLAYSLEGEPAGRSAAGLQSPSSVTPGRGPLFDEDVLLVTEKGTIGDLTSATGNRLSLLPLSALR